MSRRIIGRTAAAAIVAGATFALAACGSSDDGSGSGQKKAGGGVSGKVYFLTPGAQAVRYLRFDGPNMKAAFAELAPGIQFQTLDSQNTASKQLAQAETAIANNAKAIVIASVDPKQAAAILNKAAAAKIPVISYAPEAFGGPLYARVSVPFIQIGQAQGKYLAEHLPKSDGPVRLAQMYGDPGFEFYTELKKGFDQYVEPLVRSGKVKVVCKADALTWSPTNAQKNMDQCLSKTNNGVDAVLAMNDDTGGGALAAAKQAGVASKLTLYGGYDATIDGVQRVVAGRQAADMTPPYKAMATTAAKLAIAAIKGEKPPRSLINGVFDSQFSKTVPAAYIPNVFITRDNVDKTVVQAGIYTKAAICKGQAASSSWCTS